MIELLMMKLVKANTKDELLSYQGEIEQMYSDLFHKIKEEGVFIEDYNNIKGLHDLNYTMMQYYGSDFYRDCGLPFLKEHRPETLDVIEFSILFYTLLILDLVKGRFWNNVGRCVYREGKSMYERDHVERVDFTELYPNQGLFLDLWYYFEQRMLLEDESREISLYIDNSHVYYINDADYEHLQVFIYERYKDSKYSNVIRDILGHYKVRFTEMRYIVECQPLFVETAFRYMNGILHF